MAKKFPKERIPSDYDPSIFSRIQEDIYSKISDLSDAGDRLKDQVKKGLWKSLYEIGQTRKDLNKISDAVNGDGQGLPVCENLTLVRQWGRIVVVKFDKHRFRRMRGVWRYEWHISSSSGQYYSDDDTTNSTVVRTTRTNRAVLVIPNSTAELADNGTFYINVRPISLRYGKGHFATQVIAGEYGTPSTPSAVSYDDSGRAAWRFWRRGWMKLAITEPTTYTHTGDLDADEAISGYYVMWVSDTIADSYETLAAIPEWKWHKKFFLRSKLSIDSGIAYPIIRNLRVYDTDNSEGTKYYFKVAAVGAWNNVSDYADGNDDGSQSAPYYVEEDDLPDGVTTIITDTDNTNYRGSTGGRFARFAYETLGWSDSELDAYGAAYIHLRYWPTAHTALKHSRVYAVKNMATATDTDLGTVAEYGLTGCCVYLGYNEKTAGTTVTAGGTITNLGSGGNFTNYVSGTLVKYATDTALHPGDSNICVFSDNTLGTTRIRAADHTTAYKDETDPVTVCFWIKNPYGGTTAASSSYCGWSYYSEEYGYMFYPDATNGRIIFHQSTSGTPLGWDQRACGDCTFTDDVWYFICAVYSGSSTTLTSSNVKLYIASSEDSSLTELTVYPHPDNTMYETGQRDWIDSADYGYARVFFNYDTPKKSYWDNHRIYLSALNESTINNIFQVESKQFSNTFRIARLGGLLQNTEYDWDYKITTYGLKTATDFSDGIDSFTTAEDVVIDMSDENIDYSECVLYQMTRGFFKRQTYKLHVEFEADPEVMTGFADRYEIKVARKRTKWAGYKFSTHFISNETASVYDDGLQEESSWGVFAPPESTEIGAASGYYINIRAWGLGKPGTPLAGEGSWVTDDPSGADWLEIPNAELTSDDLPDPLFPTDHPEVEHVYGRIYKIKAVDDSYDFPDNFAYFTYHATNTTHTNLSLSTTEEDRRKTLCGISYRTDEHDEVVWAPLFCWDGDNRVMTSVSSDGDDLVFIVVMWTWQKNGSDVYTVQYAGESDPITSGGDDTEVAPGTGPNDGEPDDDPALNLTKTKVTILGKYDTDDITFFCGNSRLRLGVGGLRLVEGDLVVLSNGVRRASDPSNEQMRVDSSTATTVTVTRGYNGTTPANIKVGYQLVVFSKELDTNYAVELDPYDGSLSVIGNKDNGDTTFTETTYSYLGGNPTTNYLQVKNDDGIRMYDTGDDHYLGLTVGEDLAANKTLTLITGDDRTLTLSGNPTLSDWFDQEIKTTSTPTFAGLTLTGNLTYDIIEIDNTDSAYTANAATENVIIIDATDGNVTVNLPAISGISGKGFILKRVDTSTNVVTIDGNNAETIDGETTQLLYQYDCLRIIATSSEWSII